MRSTSGVTFLVFVLSTILISTSAPAVAAISVSPAMTSVATSTCALCKGGYHGPNPVPPFRTERERVGSTVHLDLSPHSPGIIHRQQCDLGPVPSFAQSKDDLHPADESNTSPTQHCPKAILGCSKMRL